MITLTIPERLLLVLTLLLAASSGCRKAGPERVIVSGTVSYRGEPIPKGTIRFSPERREEVPSSVARIVDGKYSASANGGVCVGSYRIEIVAHRIDPRYQTGATSPETEAELPTQQYLPEKYNRQTQLEIAIESGHRLVNRDFALTD